MCIPSSDPKKRTIKIRRLFSSDTPDSSIVNQQWKRVFNPNHALPIINKESLLGSTSPELLEQALPIEANIHIWFEKHHVRFYPNFDVPIQGIDAWPDRVIIIPKYAEWLLGYNTRWYLFLANSLAYKMSITGPGRS